MTAFRKKLIEVDLPLVAINDASAREKHLRHGHPSTMHRWWARRPLAACRAVLFASMVDDPSALPDEFPTEEAQRRERSRLHSIIKRLVVWENSNDEALLAEARYEIARSVARSRNEICPASPDGVLAYLRDYAPPVYDPFAGGGSIPLEAQRLGLRAVASDLNPVAVLINKALIELPPKVAGKPPVNPDARSAGGAEWRGAAGLAADVRYYGKWMRDQAFERIGHLYPKAKLPDGGEATVIAWLWARTVPCPNPACGVPMPLVRTFQLSKKSKEHYWMRPALKPDSKRVSFSVQNHAGDVPKVGTVHRNGVRCVACGVTQRTSYAREESKAGRMGEQMTAIVAEGDRKRLFLPPSEEHVAIARAAEPKWRISQKMPATAHLVSGRGYGISRWSELFTERQLVALTTFSDLVKEARDEVRKDEGSEEYANIVATYLALAFSKNTEMNSSFSTWEADVVSVRGVFGRQAIPMIFDFAEANSFANLAQNWSIRVEWVAETVEQLPVSLNNGETFQADAAATTYSVIEPVIVTDPPYYDNISYAELSDFFYVWLRTTLRDVYPDLFASMLVPIDEEMIAAPRFENSMERFERLLRRALDLIRQSCAGNVPSAFFYAYKQQEEELGGKASTGWEMMLSALIGAGFQIVGTWPMRTEGKGRLNAMSTNSLATSVVAGLSSARGECAGGDADAVPAGVGAGVARRARPPEA